MNFIEIAEKKHKIGAFDDVHNHICFPYFYQECRNISIQNTSFTL